ncbi:type IV toxin-antitoxin system AbiEi family antitoxin domain-containing protein [Pseudomonas sp. 32.2.56]|uniref:type IV toxin-antitoxin system AbiEi family antitoxin domain-containing protein n=1 Tax=Pseudomonas sp. 32.2.56 TaxID=2969303 RepID=UPI0021500F9E|nr:type IV toxin-antitoxin system AbiEi family antitoxin domain-containing protein [Pseudomonas sp. 32.2.56]MCR4508674.1 type IV toxin-antitoxin system AbiEi family antitoxin domain-containing protein [Pseudomonas sp. 32.2.56]
MSATEAISNRLKYMQKGQPFSRVVFAQVGSRAAVDKALSRLVKSGCLERVARGVYMRPKLSAYTGRLVRPSPLTVMEVITKANGETIQIHGAEAVRRLGLSTQMQVVPTFYTSGATRDIRVGNAVVRLRHASCDRLQHAGTKVGMVLSAFHYLGKEGLSSQVVSKITNAMNGEELLKLRACRMPAWMRSVLLAEAAACPASTSPKTINLNY